jgi:monoterpene epsilon-lactone hydrolase
MTNSESGAGKKSESRRKLMLITLIVLGLLALGIGSLFVGQSSPQMKIAHAYVRWQGKAPADSAALHAKYLGRNYSALAPVTDSVRECCDIREDRVLGQVVYTIAPRSNASGWHILYTHGGGFVNPLIKPHWDIVEALIKATGATVTVPIYPLAPEHQYTETFRLLEQVYKGLLQHVAPNRIIFCGDSAGGNLALTQALNYRERGLSLPAVLILFSPWVDLTLSNLDAQAIEQSDPMLRISATQQYGRWWAGSTDPRAPFLSPINADLRGLPPIHVYIGTDDVLLPDARKLRERVTAAGGQIQFHEYPGAFHVFVGATFTPEARDAYRKIAESVKALEAK